MRAEKQLLLDEVKEKIAGSTGFVITKYQGLNASLSRKFRGLVQAEQGDFEVIKKRVFLKALEKSGISFDFGRLEGHVGVVFAKKDASALTKVVVKYSEENEKVFEILGGKVEGDLYSGEEMRAISTLPGINELRSSFLSVLQAPMQNVVSIAEAHLTGLLHCLEEKAKKEQ